MEGASTDGRERNGGAPEYGALQQRKQYGSRPARGQSVGGAVKKKREKWGV